jgi:putative DNA primase/helicase
MADTIECVTTERKEPAGARRAQPAVLDLDGGRLSQIIPGVCPQCQSAFEQGEDFCRKCLDEALASASEGHPGVVIPWRSVAEVEAEDVEWLWWNRIPLGEVTLVAGDPGQGKSQFTAALTAKVTVGLPLPDGGENVKGTVLFASLEDSPSKTVRPRLERQGADLSRVLLLDQFKDERGEPRRMRASDIPALEAALCLIEDAKLIVLDPVMAYMGGGVDTNKDNEVRDVLGPLAELAQRHNIAVVVVAHLNKSDAENIIYKVSGSVGFAGLPRSVLLIGQQESTGQRGIAHIKSNLGPEMPTVEFTLDNDGFHWGKLNPELTKYKLIEKDRKTKASDERDVAKEWLRSSLNAGPRWSTELRTEAEECGISWWTLGRAKRELGVEHQKINVGTETEKEWKTRWILP